LLNRRQLLAATLLAPLARPARADDALPASLRAGGVVVAFRHALAPGTFDPAGFRLDDCSTQRNLSDEGRAQARRIGAWFARHRLAPAAVRSSPWCRCIDTATLAFGRAEAWGALGSPRGSPESTNAEHLGLLRAAVQAAARRPGRLEVWVTHMFVLSALVGENAASGEGLLLGPTADGGVRLLGRIAPA
jgi:phosphohistidine phosphatase SixA